MDHPIKHLLLDLLDADTRRDRHRIEEIHKTLAARGWRVVIERCEPARVAREEQAPGPPPMVGSMSPAEEQIYLRNRDKGHRGAGVS